VKSRVLVGRVLPGGDFLPSPDFLAIARGMGRSPFDFHSSPELADPVGPADLEAGTSWEAGEAVSILAVREGEGLAIYGIVDDELLVGGPLALRAEPGGEGESPEPVEFRVDPKDFMPELIRAKR